MIKVAHLNPILGFFLLLLNQFTTKTLMRKVDAQLVRAIRHQDGFSKGNRNVVQNQNGTTDIFFHGHRIACIFDDSMMIDNCGYWTVTTKQILNVLLGEFCNSSIYQKNFDWFLGNGDEYTGGQMLIPTV